MADNNVHITSIDSGLPEWANEATLKKIEAILNKSFGVQNKMLAQLLKTAGAKALTPEEIKKLNGELKDLKDNSKELSDNKVIEIDLSKKGQAQQRSWILWSTQLITVSNKLYDVMNQNMMAFDKLYSSGVNVVGGFENVTDGFQALQRLSLETGVRYTELSATIQKFSSAINVFGLGRFSKALANSSADLRKYGFSTKEAGELLGQYLEVQRSYNGTAVKSQEEVTQSVIGFGKRMTSLSMATGMAREALMQQIDALSKSSEALILNATMGSDATQSTLEFVSGFKDQNVGQAFLRMMSDSIKPLNATFMNFQKLGFGGFGQQLITFTNSLKNVNATEAMKRTADFVKNNQAALDMMTRQANLLRQAGMQAEADAVLSMIGGLKRQAASFNEMSEEELKKMEMTSDASKEFQNAMEKLKSSLQVLFAPFVQALTIAANVVEKVATAFVKIEESMPGLSRTIGALIVGLGGLATAVVAAKGVMKATSILTGGFGGGGKAVAGGGLGGIGGAAGGDKGGGMFGAIRGLAALGGPLAPKILLGATVLSGVIAILGLGFAAAAFTIGKALPSMAEGLTSFSQIDGKNLALVGTGLLGLSTGLAAFTATMVAASAGNIFTSLVNGITTLFGGSTIMSKMTEFANIGPGLKLAGDGLMNIANGINSIDLTKAESLSKILPKISSSGLTAASMGSIKSSTIDSPSTVSSVSTSTKQAERPETYTAGGPGKKEVAGESGINTLLTTQNGLIERLLGSSNDLISVNREILKYVKLQA